MIEGNAVYEIDESCMLGRRQEIEKVNDSEEDRKKRTEEKQSE